MISAERIRELIAHGENERVEFKSAVGGVPKNLFETISAFLNKNGGVVLLGVKDGGAFSGLSRAEARRLADEVVALSNNAQKLSPPFILDADVVPFVDEFVVAIEVPSSSQVHKCNEKFFDRSRDGDFQLRSTEQIRQLYMRKSDAFSENKIYPYLTEDDFDSKLIARVRQRMVNLRPDHPWRELSDAEFFRAAGLWRKDFSEGTEGYTLAAVMLFGKDLTILNVVPYFKIDAILRRKDLERYDDRVTIQTNLIDTFDRLMAFVAKHLPDPFYLEGAERRSLRDTIFRELLVNFLIHREYANAHHATFTIEREFAETRNANKPRLWGSLTLDNYEPFRKNPAIANIFTQIGLAEELGTGMRKISKYIFEYAKRGGIEFFEEELFRARIPLPPEEEEPLLLKETGEDMRAKRGEEWSKERGKSKEKKSKERSKERDVGGGEEIIRETLRVSPEAAQAQLQNATGLSRSDAGKSKERSGSKEKKSKERSKERDMGGNEKLILEMLRVNPEATQAQLQNATGLSRSGVEKNLRKLKDERLIVRRGGRRYGAWEILPETPLPETAE
ncbi:MAG: RNA-binding domain-containing protein [Candidatus Spyradosoma sp.]